MHAHTLLEIHSKFLIQSMVHSQPSLRDERMENFGGWAHRTRVPLRYKIDNSFRMISLFQAYTTFIAARGQTDRHQRTAVHTDNVGHVVLREVESDADRLVGEVDRCKVLKHVAHPSL
jgi:hypothetical protein